MTRGQKHSWRLQDSKCLVQISATTSSIHTPLGCDTTSHLYGIGKGTSFTKFKTSSTFCEQAKAFNTNPSPMSDVVDAGEKALPIVYNRKLTNTLDFLKHPWICEKMASKRLHVKPQVLPPTSVAAMYHGIRVYLRVQEWKGSSSNWLGMAVM